MLFQKLREYAERRMALPPTLYSREPVRYIVELDSQGVPLSREIVDTADPANPAVRRGQLRQVPRVQRTSGVKPLMLADNAEYTLGLAREKSKPTQVAKRHEAYVSQLERCAQVTSEPAVAAVVAFLRHDPLARIDLPVDFDRTAYMTFRVDGVFVTDLPSVQAFWAAEHDPDCDPENPAPVMQCVVCGERRPVVRRLPITLKGVPGGKETGTPLLSANDAAYESYGLENSLIAPTCARCAEQVARAGNELLASNTNRYTLAGCAFIYWTREPVEFDFFGALCAPEPAEVTALLQSVHSGRKHFVEDDTAFYLAAISGNGARIIVRDWIDTSLGAVQANLARWFRHQRVVGPWGEEPAPLGLYALAAATVRDPGKELSLTTPRVLLRAALTGTPVPFTLLQEVVQRNRAERDVNRSRAALIKLVLSSNRARSLASAEENREEDYMAQLDPDNSNPAYLCGRLLMVLEEAQREAIPGIKATIRDRFYGTASTTPGIIFPRLVRGSQPHLSKLERDRPGVYYALQGHIAEIMAGIPSFPRVLTIEEQGLFALGYYHQRAHDRARAREAHQQRQAHEGTNSQPGQPTGDQ